MIVDEMIHLAAAALRADLINGDDPGKIAEGPAPAASFGRHFRFGSTLASTDILASLAFRRAASPAPRLIDMATWSISSRSSSA